MLCQIFQWKFLNGTKGCMGCMFAQSRDTSFLIIKGKVASLEISSQILILRTRVHVVDRSNSQNSPE